MTNTLNTKNVAAAWTKFFIDEVDNATETSDYEGGNNEFSSALPVIVAEWGGVKEYAAKFGEVMVAYCDCVYTKHGPNNWYENPGDTQDRIYSRTFMAFTCMPGYEFYLSPLNPDWDHISNIIYSFKRGGADIRSLIKKICK